MTQAITDLTAAVTASVNEMATLVAALKAAPADDTAQIEALVAQLNTAVSTTQSALNPTPPAPATTGA